MMEQDSKAALAEMRAEFDGLQSRVRTLQAANLHQNADLEYSLADIWAAARAGSNHCHAAIEYC